MQHEEIGNMETGRSADRRASSSTGGGARSAVQGLSRRGALIGAMGAVGLGALAACASPASAPAAPSAAPSAAAAGGDAEVAGKLIGIHKKGHELWNARDLETFIPTFAPTIHYVEVAKAHEITNAEEMIEFASKWFKAAPDAKLSGVFYYCGKVADQLGDPPASLNPAVVGDYCTVSRSTLSGTQTGPLPDGQPPTNKPFSLELAEFITYRENPPAEGSLAPPWQATGGAMYFDLLTLGNQLGLTDAAGLGGPMSG